MLVKKTTRKWNTVSLSKCNYFTDINISRTPGVHLILLLEYLFVLFSQYVV